MPREGIIDLARVLRLTSMTGENGFRSARFQHVHKDKMLPADQIDSAQKAFSDDWVVQRSEHNHESPLSEADTNGREEFVKVGRDQAGLELEQRIATKRKMRCAVLRANDRMHFITEGHEPEVVSLLLGGEPEKKPGGQKSIQHRGACFCLLICVLCLRCAAQAR